MERGECLERDLDHRGKKGKQDIEGIFSTMELQWPGTTLLRTEICACSHMRRFFSPDEAVP